MDSQSGNPYNTRSQAGNLGQGQNQQDISSKDYPSQDIGSNPQGYDNSGVGSNIQSYGQDTSGLGSNTQSYGQQQGLGSQQQSTGQQQGLGSQGLDSQQQSYGQQQGLGSQGIDSQQQSYGQQQGLGSQGLDSQQQQRQQQQQQPDIGSQQHNKEGSLADKVEGMLEKLANKIHPQGGSHNQGGDPSNRQ
jgi:hypothetical protein